MKLIAHYHFDEDISTIELDTKSPLSMVRFASWLDDLEEVSEDYEIILVVKEVDLS